MRFLEGEYRRTALLLIALPLTALAAEAPRPTTIDTLVTGVLSQALPALEAPVGLYVQGSREELARTCASQLASALALKTLAPVVIEAPTANEAENTARHHGVRSLIRISISTADDQVVARGDAISTWVNFWSGATPTRSAGSAVISVSVSSDTTARTLAGLDTTHPPTTSRPVDFKLTPFLRFNAPLAALTLGDIDGDAHVDLAVLLPDELQLFSGEGKLMARLALSGPLATHPTREPWGAVSIQNGRIVAWSSRREKPEAFVFTAGTLRSKGPTDELAIDGVIVTPQPGLTRFTSNISWGGKALKAPREFQSLQVRRSLALFQFSDSAAAVTHGTTPASGQVTALGSAIAMIEGTGDEPLMLTSSARTSGFQDEVRLVTLKNFEAAQSRSASIAEVSAEWQTALSRGRAILAASADLDGAPGDEALIGTLTAEGSEVLLLKGAP